MKILYITTIGITMTFFKQLIRELLDEGHTVDIICNEEEERVPNCYREWGCEIFHHSCLRTPLSKGNLQAIGQIKRLVSAKRYDIVHCHTPIAAICTRVACKNLRKHGVKVMYTAHGFHFYKGAPKRNWMLYYTIEKLCSRWTDVLITINHEDFELAKRRMKACQTEYVPGVGIDIQRFRDTAVDKKSKRKELGILEDAFLLVSVGELNANKNHEVVIRAVAELKNEKVHYVIAGEGTLDKYLRNLTYELGVNENVHLAGYRNDIAEIYKVADVCCFPSIREGLPVAVMEAIASGIPCVAMNNRGTKEIITDGMNGFLIDSNKASAFKEKINVLVNNPALLKPMSEKAQIAAEDYDVLKINRRMKEIYFGEQE